MACRCYWGKGWSMDTATSEAVVLWSSAFWLVGFAVGLIIKLIMPQS